MLQRRLKHSHWENAPFWNMPYLENHKVYSKTYFAYIMVPSHIKN